jgi:dolichyl-phosphate-mannose--protein O-mannosyl transferase
MGYDQSKCDYEPPPGVSRMYAEDCEYYKLRFVVAAFSAGTCLLMYPIARRLGASPLGAAFAALLEVFSVMHCVEGRLILLNSQLLFWLNATLYGGLRWFAAWNKAVAAGTGGVAAMPLKRRMLWALGVGFLGGCAFSVKHTGLATPGLIGVEAALGVWFLAQPLPLVDLCAYIVGMAASYSLWFAFHFRSFVYSHGTLKQEQEFMTPQFQSLLIGSDTYDPAATWTEGFWWTMVTFNLRMVAHSAATTQPHTWGSRYWQWITNARGVSYWGSSMGTAEDKSSMYLIGSPLSTWAVALVMAALPALLIAAQRTAWYKSGELTLGLPLVATFRAAWTPTTAAAAVFCAVGWGLNLLPYIIIDRTTFAYHYLPALLYGHLTLALLVDSFLGDWGNLGGLAVAGATWWYYMPWVYAIPLTEEQHAARRWPGTLVKGDWS